MTFTEDALSSEIAARLSNVQRVAPETVRAERMGPTGNPYAVYYFALSDNLQDWSENLERKQDEVIGSAYFDAPGDLRWNHYLYLVVPTDFATSESFARQKRDIEADKTYARKFVIGVDELSGALDQLQPPVGPQKTAPAVDIMGRWTERLMKANLGIVLDRLSSAETIRKISGGAHTRQPLKADLNRKPQAPQTFATKFLDAIDLVKFREWPHKRVFESFGTVNLFVGSNGVGKTSLLEAIEFAYCLDNARVQAPKDGHVKMRFKGSASWHDSKAPGKPVEMKQRNLDWYGQRDLRGSTLADSFSRFNFLPTDEPALLGQRIDDVSFEDMLSRLVAGSQAAELWDHISRLEQPIATELSKVRELISQNRKTKETLEALIKTEESAPRASDSDFSALVEDLTRLRWTRDVTKETISSDNVPALGRASSIARHLSSADLRLDGVSESSVFAGVQQLQESLKGAQRLLEQINEANAMARSTTALADSERLRLKDLAKIEDALQIDAFDALQALETLEKQCANSRQIIGSIFPQTTPLMIENAPGVLDDEIQGNQERLKELEFEISKLNRDLASARTVRESASSIVAQLRTLARHWLQTDSSHTDCPVCATPFDSGQLLRQIEFLEAHVPEDASAAIIEALEAAKKKHDRETELRELLGQLSTYAAGRGLTGAGVSPLDVFQDQGAKRNELDELEDARMQAAARVATLINYQLERNDIVALRGSAASLGLKEISKPETERVRDELVSSVALAEAEVGKLAAHSESYRLEICALFTDKYDSSESAELIVKAARDREALLQNASSLISDLKQFVDLDEGQDILILAPLIESARVAAETFSAAFARDSASLVTLATAKSDLAKTESSLKEHEAIYERLKNANDKIKQLIKIDSLTDATNVELTQVQSTADAIFRKIHSPHEYGVRRHASAPLFRLNDPEADVTLRDISTGQRAAFALSIFLAMNSKLQAAPPVLLFDDPVAHIDDFNSLSFLDHLRDLSLTESRQIFYATADARLAGLFEHKFAFLGDNFRRFDLSR